MIKLKLHTSEEGFEWSDKNVRSGATEYDDILHPIGDPTYNKTHTKEVEEDYSIWSDYLQCQKGRFVAHRKTNLINFANNMVLINMYLATIPTPGCILQVVFIHQACTKYMRI